MLLSIIVPVYNKERDDLLKFCMESLVHQTLKECYEIIAVDDASTDNSYSILLKYQEKYPQKVKVIHREKNGRQGSARNDGIRVAKGKWIGFVDADDWVSYDMYEKLLNAVKEEGGDIGGGQTLRVKKHIFQTENIQEIDKYVIKSNLKTGNLDFAQIERILQTGELIVNKIFRREIFEENNLFFPEKMFYEDIAVAAFFFMKARKFVLVNKPLYFYYENFNSTCHTIDVYKIEDRIKAAEIFRNTAERLNFDKKYLKILEYKYFYIIYISTLPYIWSTKMGGIRRLQFLYQIKKLIKMHKIDILKNEYFIKNNSNMIRSYKIFQITLIGSFVYQMFSEYKTKK